MYSKEDTMAFNGYFIKKDGVKFPNAYIAEGGYSVNPNRRTDKDSYVNGRGELVRSMYPIKRSTLKLSLISGLTDSEVSTIQSFFPNRDSVTLEYWNKESNSYKTATFYIPDITFVIDYLDESNQPIYQGFDIELIAYGGDS